MTLQTTCPCCGTHMELERLSEAVGVTVAMANQATAYVEVLRYVAANGPITLDQINAREWEHLRQNGNTLQPVNVRQLQGRANKATAHCAEFALLVSQQQQVGGSKENPVVFLYLVPGSPWRGLEGAETHADLSDRLMS